MKRFVRVTALLLAALFLTGAAFAWIDLWKRENLLTDPLLKPAAGFLTTGLMFLAVGLRGWRRHRQTSEAPAAKSD
jgi:hypothetical protein